jgi:hypothetical protein
MNYSCNPNNCLTILRLNAVGRAGLLSVKPLLLAGQQTFSGGENDADSSHAGTKRKRSGKGVGKGGENNLLPEERTLPDAGGKFSRLPLRLP